MNNKNDFISHHSYAISIEHLLCNIFNCERGNMGNVVNFDYIDEHHYSALACALAVYYPHTTIELKDLSK